MRRQRYLRPAAVVLLWLLVSPGASAAFDLGGSDQDAPQGAAYGSTSWALGVVVPEGSKLQTGGGVRWEDASNVTAALTLPDSTRPDGAVYAVLSVMTEDRSVLQGAVGLAANRTEWFAYSWYIPDVRATPLRYVWILNSSGLGIAPGSEVSISVFRADASWSLRIGLAGAEGVEATFPEGASTPLRVGDQEVFALESYSSTTSVFQDMGNLTLNGVYVDRQRVVTGFYPYADWEPAHNPLFVVGSAGTSPPSFISLLRLANGTSVWSYSPVWRGSSAGYTPGLGVAFVLIMLAAAVVVVAFAVFASRRVKGSEGALPPTPPASGQSAAP